MNMQTLESSERVGLQWGFAVDALPQLIFLVDRAGQVLHANHTLERWGLGLVEEARGADLHDVLHKDCGDQDCYLRSFWREAEAELSKCECVDCDIWDPLLKRHFEIRTRMPEQKNAAGYAAFFAMVSINDVTKTRAREEQSREAAQSLHRHIESEVQRFTDAENLQLHLLTILDKTPVFTAMADCGGEIFYLNPAGRVLMGLEDHEALSGLKLIDCLAPGAQAHIAREAVLVAERDGVWSGDSVLLTRDGCEIKSYLTLIGHCDESGHLKSYCLLARDMTDWVRTEEALRATQNQLWRLSAQHLTIQENERRRIALDLHDGLGQTLCLVKRSVEEAVRSLNAGVSCPAAATLDSLGATVKSALAELRRISMNLRPSTLDDLGILATLSWYFREFEAACPNMKLERDISVAEADVPEPLKISIFRIVQEATSNALKHAGAECICVCLRGEGGNLELSIEDNGQGFDPAAVASNHDFGQGLGLQSMMERAELSGGDYQFKSVPGQGTHIRVLWPVQELSKPDWVKDPQPLVQPTGKPPVIDPQLPDRFSACLACMTSLRSQ